MRRELYEPYRALHNSGVEVPKQRQPPMNAGGESETTKHFVCKQLVAFVAARNHGYMTGVEVETVNDYEIDVVLWGVSDRLTYAAEVETSPTEDIRQQKRKQYVDNHNAIDDMLWVNVTEMPLNMIEATEYIEGETGL